ncbi:MAG: hypothetical protein IKM65_05045 [Bacteroidaceae bacterium]|nr:hypothetical protein [Bacteroidaceae bacterium]
MKKSRITLIILYLLTLIPGYSQSNKEQIILRNERFSKIDFYRAAIGIDAAVHHNWALSPKIGIGIGSSRNILNANIGLQYKLGNPFYFGNNDRISYSHLAMYASLDINLLRGKERCLFVGGEIAHNWGLSSDYTPSTEVEQEDNYNVSKHFFSAKAKIGLKIKRYELALSYEYDLSPALNQKYIYESKYYNYDKLYDSIFERARIGIGLTYYIPFEI